MKYAIECEGILYGPFDTDQRAADWARKNCAPDWRLRTIHTLPGAVTGLPFAREPAEARA
jgi:hypothetical protein